MKPITMDAMLIEGRAMAFVDISPCETTWGCGGAVDECGEKVNNNLRLNKNVALQGSTQEPRSCFAGVSKMTCGLCRRTKAEQWGVTGSPLNETCPRNLDLSNFLLMSFSPTFSPRS
jgi:hypothetical protein